MSDAEEALAFQLKAVNVPFEREVEFAKPERKFRADFVLRHIPHKAVPDFPTLLSRAINPCLGCVKPLIVEVEGGTYTQGRHTQGPAFEADCVKQAEALTRGYRYLRVTPHMIEDGRALSYIERLLGLASGNER